MERSALSRLLAKGGKSLLGDQCRRCTTSFISTDVGRDASGANQLGLVVATLIGIV